MSTYYAPAEPIPFKAIFNKKFAKRTHIRETQSENSTKDYRCLYDGKNYLWCSVDGMFIYAFTRYGGNSADDILVEIESETGIPIYSEHSEDDYGNQMVTVIDFQNRDCDDETREQACEDPCDAYYFALYTERHFHLDTFKAVSKDPELRERYLEHVPGCTAAEHLIRAVRKKSK